MMPPKIFIKLLVSLFAIPSNATSLESTAIDFSHLVKTKSMTDLGFPKYMDFFHKLKGEEQEYLFFTLQKQSLLTKSQDSFNAYQTCISLIVGFVTGNMSTEELASFASYLAKGKGVEKFYLDHDTSAFDQNETLRKVWRPLVQAHFMDTFRKLKKFVKRHPMRNTEVLERRWSSDNSLV